MPRRSVRTLPDDGTRFGALRRVAVGDLSWTLYYPEVLVGPEAAADPRIAEAARLLVAGQRDAGRGGAGAGAGCGVAGGLAAALRTSIAVARRDAAGAEAPGRAGGRAGPGGGGTAARAILCPAAGAGPGRRGRGGPEATGLAPREALPQARLAELYLMQGERAKAVRAADAAAELRRQPAHRHRAGLRGPGRSAWS